MVERFAQLTAYNACEAVSRQSWHGGVVAQVLGCFGGRVISTPFCGLCFKSAEASAGGRWRSVSVYDAYALTTSSCSRASPFLFLLLNLSVTCVL